MNAIQSETMLPAGRMRAIAMLAACALFMEAMDGTIVAIALPEMARYFRVDVVDMNVGMTSYLLALAVLLPLSAWVAERLQYRQRSRVPRRLLDTRCHRRCRRSGVPAFRP